MTGCQQLDLSPLVYEIVEQAGGENDGTFEFFREISIRCRFFDQWIESDGYPPVVIAGEFADHQLGSLRSGFPVDMMVMVVREVPADRIEIASAPFKVTFDAPIVERNELNEIIERFRLRIDSNFSRGLDDPSLFDETEGKSCNQN